MARGRKKNAIPTTKLPLSTTAAVLADLQRLVTTGYFGKTPTEAAELILRERLRVMRRDEPDLFLKRAQPTAKTVKS